MNWREAYQFAIDETKFGYRGLAPTKEEFLETFKEYWNEVTAENIITMWAVDPPGTKRIAVNKATVEYADNWSDK